MKKLLILLIYVLCGGVIGWSGNDVMKSEGKKNVLEKVKEREEKRKKMLENLKEGDPLRIHIFTHDGWWLRIRRDGTATLSFGSALDVWYCREGAFNFEEVYGIITNSASWDEKSHVSATIYGLSKKSYSGEEEKGRYRLKFEVWSQLGKKAIENIEWGMSQDRLRGLLEAHPIDIEVVRKREEERLRRVRWKRR
jgi:hypothetical protein